MMWQKSIRVLLVISVLLIPVNAKTQKMHHIATGVWGGEHIRIEVGAKSAAVEYDCATGVINGPLVVDSNGEFNLRGIHKMERGGPIRADDNPKQHEATYTGSIKGNTISLTLKFADFEPETFTLEKGKPGDLFKCK